MTISTTTSRQSYNGNGVTTVFSVPFRFFQNTDLVLELVTISSGASTTLTLTTHYTVTGADDEDGGSVTMVTAPAVGERLVIRRVITATQEVDYISGESFPAETHERALDRLTMLVQQADEVSGRSLTVPVADSAFDTELPPVSALKYLRVNAAGDKFELVSVVDSGTLVVSPFIETLLDDADAATAQTTLGGTTVGKAVFTAASADAAQTAIGATTVGKSLIVASDAAVAFTAIKQAASETATGVVELATTTEASTGTDTARAVTPAGLEAHMLANALGWSQTSQDLTASRASGTTYTNSTGRPIKVEVSTGNAATAQITFFRGGVKRSRTSYNGSSGSVSLSMMVPNGETYSATVVGGIEVWTETR